MKKNIALTALFALSVPATAIAGVFYNNPGAFSLEHPRDAMANAWLVRVKPGSNARFYWNVVTPGCPALKPACKAKGYLVPGDIAVAAYTTGSFTVVEFVGPKGAKTDGAIESRLLERIEAPKPSPRDWIGHWKYDGERSGSVCLHSDRRRISGSSAGCFLDLPILRVLQGGLSPSAVTRNIGGQVHAAIFTGRLSKYV